MTCYDQHEKQKNGSHSIFIFYIIIIIIWKYPKFTIQKYVQAFPNLYACDPGTLQIALLKEAAKQFGNVHWNAFFYSHSYNEMKKTQK